MFQHNTNLKHFIDEANDAVSNASSPQDLLNVIEKAKQFNGNLKFDNRDYLAYAGGAILLFLIGIYIGPLVSSGFSIFLVALSIFAAIIIFVRFNARRKLLKDLSERIFYRDFLFDNNLEFSHSEAFTLPALQARFSDFNHGNYSREIYQMIRGHFTDPEAAEGKQTIEFHVYQFHYIDKRTVEERDSNGKKTTKTVYDHYDRYGIIIPFPAKSQLSIRRQKRVFGLHEGDYAPASLNFRKQYIVHTKDEHFAAKFLKPRVVEILETLPDEYSTLLLQTSSSAELLFSFNNRDLLKYQRNHSLAETDAFLEEVKGITKAPKLERTLKILCHLIHENDNNFV